MKVILLQDVAKLGHKHDIVNVPDGYGMNKLLPQRLAKPATAENVKAIEKQAETQASLRTESQEAFTALIAALEGKEVVITAEANEEGRLFQAIKAEQVAEALSAATEKTVTAGHVVIEAPIKSVGEHIVVLAAGASNAKQTVTVAAK